MSAQTRYRTLVANTGAIYAAAPETRTTLLQKGLDEVMGAIEPVTADQWKLVMTDSDRLLKVWHAKESDPAATHVVTQLLDLLRELSSAPSPTLVVSDPPVSDRIAHIRDFVDSDDERLVAVNKVEEEEEEVEEEEEEEVEEEEEEVEEEVEEEEEEEEEVEEEDGMEVEQVFVRGRSYWFEAKTNKLFANDNDEVGAEVGAMVNGKANFLAK